MKKVVFTITAAATLLISCSKETSEVENPEKFKKTGADWTQFEEYSGVPTTQTEFTSIVESVYQSIDDGDLSAMSLNEAVWKLEATLNHVFRHKPYSNQDLALVSYTYDLSVNESGTYDGSDLENVFIPVHNDIINDERDFLVSNFSVTSYNENNGDATVKVDVYYYDNASIIYHTALPTTASDRKAVTPEDCNGNPAMAAIDKIPELSFNKASNTRSYDATLYYSLSNVRSYSSYGGPNIFSINDHCLPGGNNALYSHHQNGVHGSACFNSSEISGYRDQVLGDINLAHGNSQDFIINIDILFDFYLNGSGYGEFKYDLVNVAESWGNGQGYTPHTL